MKTHILAAAVLSSLATAGTAHAASIVYTAPIPSGLTATVTVCQAVNIGSKAAEVTVDIVNLPSGSVASTMTSTLEPGGLAQAAILGLPPGDSLCRVSGISSKRVVVAYGQYDSLGGKPVMTVSVP